MGAVHDVSGLYYGPNEITGHPSDAVGWAIGAGLKLNAPMIGAGDYFQAQVNYAEGATGYVAAGAVNYSGYRGATFGYGLQADGVYGINAAGPTSVELTTAWGVDASYEHHWNKKWQTSVYGSYIAINYNSTANALACAVTPIVTGTCDNDYSYWDVGTRTQFNLDANTYVGLDVVYTHLNTASDGATLALVANGTKPAGIYSVTDQSAWIAQFRVHRNFYP
jgi:hypothetical protein